jgi:hypothetical protein
MNFAQILYWCLRFRVARKGRVVALLGTAHFPFVLWGRFRVLSGSTVFYVFDDLGNNTTRLDHTGAIL